MKIMQIVKALRARAAERRQSRKDVQYYDNYTMLGSILGGYCGMWRFDGK